MLIRRGRTPLATYLFTHLLLLLHFSLLLQSLFLRHWTHLLLLLQTLPPLQSPLVLHWTHFLFAQTLLPSQSRSFLHFCLPSTASPAAARPAIPRTLPASVFINARRSDFFHTSR